MIEVKNKNINFFFGFLVVANTALFLLMANFHWLSTDPKSAVFVDFWGRFTVYSLWFIGFVLYTQYVLPIKPLKYIVLLTICLNIPLFLLLAYFDKISNSPETIVMVDFWGRITVYSLWVLCYEAYRQYLP